MDNLNRILESFHYLNHPYLSGISAVLIILAAIFVVVKDSRSSSHWAFFWFCFPIFWWFSGNVFSMIYYQDFERSLLWYRIAYVMVPFMGVGFYNFFRIQLKRSRTVLIILFLIGILENLYLWGFEEVRFGAYSVINVGVVWQGMPRFSYFLMFGMVKFIMVTLFCAFTFLKEAKIEKAVLKSQQFRSWAMIYFVITGGCTEWLVAFNVRLHVAWIVIPAFIFTFGYVIVNYRVMKFDTVIHYTLLWIMTILLLILPGGLIGYFLRSVFPSAGFSVHIAICCVFLIFFVTYYNYLRPKIDHLFRRRQYDYQTILGRIAEKIVTCINIQDLSARLLQEVCETMYLRNDLLYILSKDNERYSLIGRKGYHDKQKSSKASDLEMFKIKKKRSKADKGKELSIFDPFCMWLSQQGEILEKDRVEVDPKYSSIKKDALEWFQKMDIEVAVPITYQNSMNAILGIGKRENLRSFRRKDIELLQKLSREIGVTVFNALHYHDLIEKERMEEEMRMGRDIQMSLLPKEHPDIPHLYFEGLMLPAKEIGGDYYDFIALPNKGHFGIVIGDVSGKGVGAGLCMAMVKTSMHIFAQRKLTTKQVVLEINDVLNKHIGGEKFMTMLYLIWDPKNSKITYTSAGHEYMLLCRNAHKKVEEIKTTGIVLGIEADVDQLLEEKSIRLSPKDKILLYTDGVTDARNKAKKRFGMDRLKNSFEKNSFRSCGDLINAIKDEVYTFIGSNDQYDDITLVAMERK
ncbi:MAG: SpoIIE family protein phosphatase [Spirochaetes bacterium]|nr:SpoIIE family protein phosphatase [Spirochaetota bacterium]